MTNKAPGQPTDPRDGASPQPTSRGVYNPIRIGNPGNNQQPDWFENLETPQAQMLVALLFALIFGIAWHRPEFGPLTIIVVVGCLLYRFEPWQRKLASVPVLLAAIRFYLLPVYSAEVIWLNQFHGKPTYMPGNESGIPWIPAFLSVCLFFMPRTESATLKIIVVESITVVLSSLLPGEGFLTILAVFNYTLFFAVTVGLFIDLKGLMNQEA
jgi:hypothetical protein